MGHTFLMLTASLLASQGTEGQVQVTSQPHHQTGSGSCNCGSSGTISHGSSPGFFDRFRGRTEDRPVVGFFSRMSDRMAGMFGRTSEEPAYAGRSEMISPVPNSTPVIMNRMPSKVNFTEPPLNVNRIENPVPHTGTTQVVFRPAQPANNVINAKFLDKIGHEEDFTWVTGQLGRMAGNWVVHYATPETVDRFGGNLVLLGNTDMSRFQIGDLVSIQGSVVFQTGRQPGYLIQSIHILEQK